MANLMRNSVADWNLLLAEAIYTIEKNHFKKNLIAALRSLVPFDFSVMFAYRSNEKPLDLFDNFGNERRDIFVIQYQEGPYLLDPFFQACRNRIDPGLYRLKEFAPDRFYQSEYYRSYYKKTELAEEIGFFVALPKDAYVVISLMRAANSSVFSQKEMRILKEIEPIIRALAKHHWKNVHMEFSSDEQAPDRVILQEQMEEAFRTFGKTVLTPRELEVVGLVLRGYSSDAIAEILKIATGTVKTYRRSIYAKLGISSQSELFSMFITSLQK